MLNFINNIIFRYRFDTSEITHIVPSSLSSLGSLDRMFMTNFESQTAAEFPSYELDGNNNNINTMLVLIVVYCDYYC